MANSEGGCILLGVEEKDAVIEGLLGLAIDPEVLLQQIQQITESTTRPRVRIKSHLVALRSGKKVLAVAVERSRSGPHMALADDDGRFYRRAGRETVRMDVDELRKAFSGSLDEESVAIADHRAHVEKLKPFWDEGAFVCALDAYLLPTLTERVDPTTESTMRILGGASCFGERRGSLRPVFVGVASSFGQKSKRSDWQFRRTASIITHFVDDELESPQGRYLGAPWFCRQLVVGLKSIKNVYTELGLRDPVLICLTLAGMRQRQFKTNNFLDDDLKFQEMRLEFPPIYAEDSSFDLKVEAREWLNRLWNAAGSSYCPLYVDKGRGAPDESAWSSFTL